MMNKFNRIFVWPFWGSFACFCFVVFAGISFGGCVKKSQKSETDSLHVGKNNASLGKDSTLYGVAGESGMSTFCLIVDSIGPVYVTKDNEKGQYGEIFGDLNEGDRFSLSTRDNGETLAKAVNLTQLSRFPISYRIFNGNLVLDNKMVDIKKLDNDSLVVNYSDGKSISFAAKE